MNMEASGAAPFDVIVIGGGLTGCAIARDCALRGLRVMLIDADDIASGKTGVEPGLLDAAGADCTREQSVRIEIELEELKRSAGELVWETPVIWPLVDRSPGPALRWRHMQAVAAAQNPSAVRNGAYWGGLGAEEIAALEPALSLGGHGGMLTAGWQTDLSRLAAHNLRGAEQQGAVVVTGHHVLGLVIEDGKVLGVQAVAAGHGEWRTWRAEVVVNAAGAGCGRVAELTGSLLPLHFVRKTYLHLASRLTGSVIALAGADTGGFRMIPLARRTVIGPVRTVCESAHQESPPREEDLDCIRGVASRLIDLSHHRELEARVAVEARWSSTVDPRGDRPREPQLFDHSAAGAPGLITAVGGTPLEHRWLAERVGDRVCAYLRRGDPCQTRQVPLVETAGAGATETLADQFTIPADAAEDLVRRHAGLARDILVAGQAPALGNGMVCRCEAVLASEIAHVVEHEQARRTLHVARRTGLGSGPCQGMRCLAAASQLLQFHRGVDAAGFFEALLEVKEQRFQACRSLLSVANATSLALDRQAHMLSGNLNQTWNALRREEKE